MRRALVRSKASLLRRYGLLRSDWENSLPEEVQFWAKALSDPHANWSYEEFARRTDPELPLQDELRDLLHPHCGNVARILDVGAGPLTRVGKVWKGKSLDIIATDPLAEEYDKILEKVGIKPLIRTIAVQGEKLTEHFAHATFDLAYASNSLDHAKDPLEIIRQMTLMVKPGSHIYLWHFVNSGIEERYTGLHQWNFYGASDDLFVDDGRKYNSVQKFLGPNYRVQSKCEHDFGCEVVVTTIARGSA
jgi:SAM-dependent methyltransferase